MKKFKILSLILALALLACSLNSGLLATEAHAEGTSDSGMEISKTATANSDGSYTITLEAYATGTKVISSVNKDVPTDIVLVLDQSGSMDYCIVCGEAMDGNNNYHYTYSYTATTDINTSQKYYIKSGSTYIQVEYCSGRHGFIITWPCAGGAGWYVANGSSSDHTADAQITPKTNNDPDGVQFYTRTQGSREPCTSRLDSLKSAVTTFANNVTMKAKGTDGLYGTSDDVNHRIAIVGFASSDTEYNDDKFENTEIFVGGNAYTYGTSAQGQYKNAFQKMNSETGYNNVIASKNALDGYGGTFTNLGMEMANGIFAANPIPAGQIRNRVVVVFTDGYPGTGSSVNSTVANNAVSQGYTAKKSTANGGYGATVYTVGIFSGADGTPVSSFSNVTDPNKFMHLLSSNYESAQSYSDSTKYGTATYPAGGGSYYLSAGDTEALNSIFEQISEQIESGGSSTTLSSDTVIKDIISPAFTLPQDATADNITLETYRCTGKNDDVYTWTKNENAMGATATVNDGQVSVTGFNFAENYVGTVTENGSVTYRGHKLVIKFNVTPKAGFLGGNNVYTNTSAGVYENSSATDPVLTFNRPQVNVPIGAVSVTAQDKNVYLLSGLTAAQLKEGATVTVGGVPLDLSKANDTTTPYGLEPWQTEYVNITVEVEDANGNVVTGLSSLTDDTTYTVSVTVSPKTDGTGASGDPATAKSGVNSPAAKINVFKPDLTLRDSEVYYGDAAPTVFSNNLTTTLWKHGTTQADYVAMIGDVPKLALAYTPEAGKIVDGKINTKQDIPVDVTVKIGSTDVTGNTTFLHTNCTGKTCTLPEDKEFLLHVKTCQLTITKSGGADNESYVFNVYKDGAEYTEVTIWGNDRVTIYELPVGEYTIKEDTGWSWRYTANNGSTASLSSTSPSGTITCTNKPEKNSWLNGFSEIVKNICGTPKSN